jgi:hypothetical protein
MHGPPPAPYTGRWRTFAKWAAGVLTVVSLLLSIMVVVFSWSSIWILTFWFLLLLFLFHCIFFWCTGITARQIKLIDYPYLLIGGFSILLAFADSNKERDTHLRELDQIAVPATVNDLQSLISNSRAMFCNGVTDYKPVNYCKWTHQISEFLQKDFTLNELKNEITDRRDSLSVTILGDQRNLISYYFSSWENFKRLIYMVSPFHVVSLIKNWQAEPITVQPAVNLTYTLIIGSLQKLEKPFAQPAQGPGTPEVSVTLGSIAIGLGKVLVWPFFLAIAAALRITKVTADVSGWAV